MSKKSHAGTVVPECFKDGNESQWKTGKSEPLLSPKPLNLWPQNFVEGNDVGTLTPVQNFITIR